MTKVPTDTFKNYVIYLFLMFEMLGTAWLCGSNNHTYLRYWYVFTMATLFITRIYSFYRKNYLLYLYELCYAVNIVSMFSVYLNIGIEYVYPFLHGPLIAYSLFFGDALILHDLDKTTSLAVHCFGAIITRRLYWHGDEKLTLEFSDLTLESFKQKMLISFLCYSIWAFLYSVFFLFPYNGQGLTMVRYVARLEKYEKIPNFTKIKYIFYHMIYSFCALIIGNLSMYIWQLDYLLITIQIISGIGHGGWYYYKEHKFKYNEAHDELMKSIKNHITLHKTSFKLKIKESENETEHIEMTLGTIPKLIKESKKID